ncbi:NADH-quinone oxidoreductase subunit NuoG [Chitinophagaceae bacterium LB-8]|uniref:NADH-quinone oxidoreductase n=1 Tax=Paraflavisolibacter caeni TaxID=2982496 RepID=A0A9X2XT69_9BACT|nr:NADH-quinone oxidoreductase subunit NuoG [Paraflavisolibacter caeni]MCU7548095.1 NADH-quinone oxidoreductase subunit NuoG [Paraflavisolibacter caeni]
MPTIYIDNKPYEVKEGKNLLEACLTLGFDLPYFCWHPALNSVGACRQCAVKVYKDEADTKGRLVMSCMEGVKDGMRLSINDQTAKAFREQIIEWLMTNHPHDCPVCDEGGSCHLQDMTVMTGHDYRRYTFRKRTYKNQYLGPLLHHEMNRCIQCYRCVRYYRDYAGGDDLNVFAAHNHVYFGRDKDGVLQSPFSGNLAEVCPTGVFTDKTLKEHYTRKWDLTMAPSVCNHCSVGCNIIAGERYGELRCILNRYNGDVNGYFICDRGRYGYEFVNSENRIKQPIIRNRTGEAASEEELMRSMGTILTHQKLLGIGSPRASVESNFALMQLVGHDNFYQGVSEAEAYLTRKIAGWMQTGSIRSASLKEIEQSDVVVVLGEDIWNTAPMMALAVRQSVVKTAAAQAAQKTNLPLWHDAAIKEYVQDQKGFLANITVAGSPLDEIAAHQQCLAPDDIARLGWAIAHELDASLPGVSNDESLLQQAQAIANALKTAKNPVIISGITCYNESILTAAVTLATACHAKVGFALPECNSMGLALMQAPSLEKAVDRMQREGDSFTVVVLENDLYRNISATLVDDFFSHCRNAVVIDSLHNATTEKAQVLIPSATFAEGDGTLVNYEGRAQRYFQVFVPAEGIIKESWKWLWHLYLLKMQAGNGHDHYPNELLEKLESVLPQFKGITKSSPPRHFTIHGERIPREPHRYSGRTAMLADRNVSEPKPVQDNDSPFSFTMEGFKGLPPAPLIPFFWAPGWNSVQAVTKYQEEPGGSLKGGDPGISLFKEPTQTTPLVFHEIPEAFAVRHQKWLLLPQYHVLGSGELSSYTKALQELSPQPSIALSAEDLQGLGVEEGSSVQLKINGTSCMLPVKIQKGLPKGIALVAAGLQGSPVMSWGEWGKIDGMTNGGE